MPVPNWIQERKEVIESRPVLYWAVFVKEGNDWSFQPVQTFGNDVTPHTFASVRRIVSAFYSRVGRMAVLGPYWDSDSAYRVLTMAQNDPAFWHDVKAGSKYFD